jgi:hypothetical protein
LQDLTKDEILDFVIATSIPFFNGRAYQTPQIDKPELFEQQMDFFAELGCDREVLIATIALGKATDPIGSIAKSDGSLLNAKDVEKTRDALREAAQQLSLLERTHLLDALNRRFLEQEKQAGRALPEDAEQWELKWPFLISLPEWMNRRAAMLDDWLTAVGSRLPYQARVEHIKRLYPVLYIRYVTREGHYPQAADLLLSVGQRVDSAQLSREVLHVEKSFPLALEALHDQFELMHQGIITYPVQSDHSRTQREMAKLIEEGVLSDDSQLGPDDFA